ncbi:MAG: flagellar hook-length control protein FliK [Pseudomonadota bacterium]
MIEASQSIQQITQRSTDTRNGADEAPVFTLALAAATLETRASLSLEVHGAAPQNSATASTSGAAQQSSAAAKNTDRVEQASPPAGNDAARASHAEQSNAPRHSQPSLTAAPASPAAPDVSALQSTTPVQSPVIAQTAAGGVQTVSASRETPAAPRSGDTTLSPTRAQKTTAPARAPEPAAATQEFARLLARRLDNATAFDIRLDPPELGRLEGRFTIGDDGKSVLALKFDNQTALDLFAKDETALRTALADAGFDLGGNDLAFSLQQDDKAPPLITDVESASLVAAPALFEPRFQPAFSDGVLDISV